VASTLLTSGDTRTNEEEALLLELFGATDRVWVVRIAAIDDDVALLEVRLKLVDEVVNSLASLDEKDDLAGFLELAAKLFNRMCTLDVSAYTRINSVAGLSR
jgi:hypothetical protein